MVYGKLLSGCVWKITVVVCTWIINRSTTLRNLSSTKQIDDMLSISKNLSESQKSNLSEGRVNIFEQPSASSPARNLKHVHVPIMLNDPAEQDITNPWTAESVSFLA
jgi:hypothetical protein